MASRYCSGNPVAWDVPDLSNCVSKWMADIAEQVCISLILPIVTFFSQFPKHTKREPPPLISKHRLFTHCCVMSYYQVIPCHVIPYDVTPLDAMSCDTKLCHIMSCHLIHVTPSRAVVTYHVTAYLVKSYHVLFQLPCLLYGRSFFFLR